jgi:hypothetical protein
MKKLFITAAIAILFSISAFATDGGKGNIAVTGEGKISYTVLNQFAANFKNAKNASWAVTPNCQKVTFTLDGAQMTAFYDLASGSYLGTTEDIDFKTIPFSAQEEITSKYAGYGVKEVIKYETDGTNPEVKPLVYFVDLKKADGEVLVTVTPGEGTSLFKKIK